ncbi:hypothetical protein BXZ70DRAFT_459908 [Cristinia sonorae]|uniref:Uncharacterized protein n=1 Tax=Cristinia sonorae TaxID=1940300 RepID=A0A8K0UIV1_9AGAR|nr:hypothetical protein BXZ70DRAFT_459908 [Cristinia sonorae]
MLLSAGAVAFCSLLRFPYTLPTQDTPSWHFFPCLRILVVIVFRFCLSTRTVLILFLSSYRIHLSPGSRRRSATETRRAMTLAQGPGPSTQGASTQRRRSRTGTSSSTEPPDTPPALSQSLGEAAAALIPEPPETPPPLEEARLPGMFAIQPSAHATGSQSMVSYFQATPHGSLSPHNADERSYPDQNSAEHSPTWEYRNGQYSYPGQDHLASSSHTNNYEYADAEQTPSPTSSASSQQPSQTYTMPQTAFNTYPNPSMFGRTEGTQPQSLAIHSPLAFTATSRSLAHGSQPSPLSAHSPLASQPPTPTYSTSSLSGHITPHDVDMDTGAGSPLIHRHSSDLALHSRYAASHNALSGAGYGQQQRGVSSSGGDSGVMTELPLPVVNSFSVPPSPAQQHYPHSYPHTQSIQTHYSGAGTTHHADGADSRYTSASSSATGTAVILPPIHEERGARAHAARDQRRRYTDSSGQMMSSLGDRRGDGYTHEYDRRDTQASFATANYTLVPQPQQQQPSSHVPLHQQAMQYSTSADHYGSRGYMPQDGGYRSGMVHQNT